MKTWVNSLTALLGVLTIALGAFGAHYFKTKLSSESIASYHTGVLYQFIHVGFLLFLGHLLNGSHSVFLKFSIFATFLGILFFSGSIYVLSTWDLFLTTKPSYLGPVTPLGGLIFMSAWFSLALHFIKIRNLNS